MMPGSHIVSAGHLTQSAPALPKPFRHSAHNTPAFPSRHCARSPTDAFVARQSLGRRQRVTNLSVSFVTSLAPCAIQYPLASVATPPAQWTPSAGQGTIAVRVSYVPPLLAKPPGTGRAFALPVPGQYMAEAPQGLQWSLPAELW